MEIIKCQKLDEDKIDSNNERNKINMNENIWDIECEKIIPQELSDEEKKIAQTCSDTEMEFKEIMSMIDNLEEK